eukprot:Phypoly_transcript_14505.p1 GENE.Phypoly_transcript_14505~~Phypoly_transcript_14505.p1  ORF type:complete len:316 (+),score=114.99 Phypoly_transcript_14505:56-949(+)
MADINAEFSKLTRKKYADQAKWFLNGFWRAGAEENAEQIWEYTQKFISLDPKKGEGNELDEFWSHKFLETFGETLTIVDLREQLKRIDVDVNRKMALLEYLLFRFKKSVKQCVEAPQGGNEELLAAAQAKLNAVQNALIEQQAALEAQKAQEEKVKKAEVELKAAVEDLKRQEEEYQNKIRTLEKQANDTSGSMVARNKAANELAQVKSEDPLPLRKAKITQEAALKKTEKERKAAEVATQNLEKKVRELETLFAEAEAKLKELREQGGSAQGAIWWMTRELKEAQKYLPKKKQTLL